jgi:hypothetical protein
LPARGDVSDTWSIVIANAILATAYGMMWAGVRNFDGRATSAPLVLAGAVIWLASCNIEAIFAAPRARTALMSAVIVSYSLVSAWELWRGRREELMFRLPVILLLLVHAAFFVVRNPLGSALPLPTDTKEIRTGWWTFTIFETVFFALCAVAERIRSNFEATTLQVGANTLTATVSVGVAMSIDPGRKLADLFKVADRALYRAKENGRNRVEHASGIPE